MNLSLGTLNLTRSFHRFLRDNVNDVMKVILSRKGFDSENGGKPSFIMPDGGMISLPIPSGEEVYYDDLKYGRLDYDDIMRDVIRNHGNSSCHFDPDLDVNRHKSKPKRWVPAFGQCGTSLKYLIETVGVEPGDLFLFFGWFHQLEQVDGRFRYVKKSGDFYKDKDLHVIWGYMQVGEILEDHRSIVKKVPWHPHASWSREYDEDNYVFVGRKNLSFAPNVSGAAILPFDKKRVLTLKGASKAIWKPNAVYMPNSIIGSRKNSSTGAGVYYSGIWQELGLKETKATEHWAKRMIL